MTSLDERATLHEHYIVHIVVAGPRPHSLSPDIPREIRSDACVSEFFFSSLFGALPGRFIGKPVMGNRDLRAEQDVYITALCI